jgi:hypothetical protein
VQRVAYQHLLALRFRRAGLRIRQYGGLQAYVRSISKLRKSSAGLSVMPKQEHVYEFWGRWMDVSKLRESPAGDAMPCRCLRCLPPAFLDYYCTTTTLAFGFGFANLPLLVSPPVVTYHLHGLCRSQSLGFSNRCKHHTQLISLFTLLCSALRRRLSIWRIVRLEPDTDVQLSR